MIRRPEGNQLMLRSGHLRRDDSARLLSGRRYLVVDDHPDLRHLVSCFIRKAGGITDEASNGIEAIERLRSSRFSRYDAVVLDMEMPVLNGYETATKIRSLEMDIPIIALTASAMVGDLDRCLSAGCDYYMTKPIDRLHMVDVLANI